MLKILFVCHGNICRSTMAESVLTHMVKQRGLEEEFLIASAATSTEEIGNPPHHGTVRQLERVGIDTVPHRAVQIRKSDLEKYDYIIGMDDANIRNIRRLFCVSSDKVCKLLSFAGEEGNIADPWYTNDFETTYRDIVRGLEGFLQRWKG